MGADLNRSWNKISEWLHPALVAIKPILKSLDKNSLTPLDCVLDLHAHTNATGIFVYGNTYDDVYRYLWPFFRFFFSSFFLNRLLDFLYYSIYTRDTI